MTKTPNYSPEARALLAVLPGPQEYHRARAERTAAWPAYPACHCAPPLDYQPGGRCPWHDNNGRPVYAKGEGKPGQSTRPYGPTA